MKTFNDCCGNISLIKLESVTHTSVGSVLRFRVILRDSRLRDCVGIDRGGIRDLGSWEG